MEIITTSRRKKTSSKSRESLWKREIKIYYNEKVQSNIQWDLASNRRPSFWSPPRKPGHTRALADEMASLHVVKRVQHRNVINVLGLHFQWHRIKTQERLKIWQRRVLINLRWPDDQLGVHVCCHDCQHQVDSAWIWFLNVPCEFVKVPWAWEPRIYYQNSNENQREDHSKN